MRRQVSRSIDLLNIQVDAVCEKWLFVGKTKLEVEAGEATTTADQTILVNGNCKPTNGVLIWNHDIHILDQYKNPRFIPNIVDGVCGVMDSII